MVEIFLMLVISVGVFLFLFLALTLKNRSGKKSTSIPTCQTCNCHKKEHHKTQKTRITETLISGVNDD